MGFLRRATLTLLLLLNFVLLNDSVFAYPYADAGNENDDASLLLRFKDSVSDPAGLLSSWNLPNSGAHCSWLGVSCNADYHVVSLNITGYGGGQGNSNPNPDADYRVFSSCFGFEKFPLYGIGIRKRRRSCLGEGKMGIKSNGGRLAGKLPSVVGKLNQLKVLSFPFNDFDGEIPNEIWGMQHLEVLDLEGNSISGSLPSWVSSPNLRVLNLGFNFIHGGIPSSLSNSVRLEVLNLAGNRLNGSVPGWIGRLKGVYLSYNSLGGNVPSEIGDNCWNLEHLDLSGNFLVHKIPSSLGNCIWLKTLLLHSNMLEEGVPSELGRLQALKVLDVSRNRLKNSSVPRELGNCSELSVLVLSSQFDPVPRGHRSGYESLLEQSQSSMTDDLNNFRGTIPVEIATLPKLRILWVPRASIEGSLPSNWGKCEHLEMVNLAQNFIIGEIPAGLNCCSKLHFLDLSSNRLTGKLVQGLQVPCMTWFDISRNMLSGSIPKYFSGTCSPASSMDDYSFQSDDPSSPYRAFFASKTQVGNPLKLRGEDKGLAVFHNFRQNNFTGTLQSLPIATERLGKQTLYAFLVGENKLTRAFPRNLFWKCTGLDSLIIDVSHNKLYGRMPGQIGAFCRSLIFLDASGNQFLGPIPSSYGNLVSLVGLDLSQNMLQGPIPTSLGLIRDLEYLSLSGNDLRGIIPSSLGQLYSLQVLDLSSNSLTGDIPNDLVNLQNLTVLLLDRNNLSGQIPSGFANVAALSAFNVSFNNLSGSLPSNNNLIKCNTALGNLFIDSCPMSSLPHPVSHAESYSASPERDPIQRKENRRFSPTEIAYIASASAIVSVLVALVVLFLYRRKWNLKSEVVGSTRREVTVFTNIGFPLTFESVLQATGNFSASNCIGNGGFGATYKAEISPGILVAVKRLSVGRFQGVQQFHAEIKTLGRLRHPNLVTLLGYHASETEMFLIYNYLPGGNLEKFIQERSIRAVDWRILHKIALDVGRALAFLHDQCVPRVLHRDVKPSNILLDDDFNAYLSDFGLARLLGTSETHATTGVAGTYGYVAPEYAMTCRVSDKADVYSYGVMLLELLSHKKALDPSFSSYGNGFNIVTWASMLLEEGRTKEFFIARLWDAGPHAHLVEVLHLAHKCTVDSLSTRPTMKQVVQQLKQLQPPSC